MVVKCAWCDLLIGDADISAEERYPVSHGICPQCAEKMLRDLPTTAKNFLDSFEQPVMLVDNVNNVLITNRAAKLMVSADFDFSDHARCGKFLGCVHADLPGGCGATVHCESCVIRRCILHTDKTGLPCQMEACEDYRFFSGERKASLVVTTEKVGDRILLKIDPVKKEESNKEE
jgi:hypothetical protein